MRLMRGKKTVAMLAITGLAAGGGLSAAAIASAQSSGTATQESGEAPWPPAAVLPDAISPDQAIQAAEQYTGQTASSVELDDENGTVLYEVKTGASEVMVDSVSGQVTAVESEEASGESADDSGEEDSESEDISRDDGLSGDSYSGRQGADGESADDYSGQGTDFTGTGPQEMDD